LFGILRGPDESGPYEDSSATGVDNDQHNDDAAGYIKWGINKPAWLDGPTAPTVRVVMHDEIRVGESFGAVEPGCVR